MIQEQVKRSLLVDSRLAERGTKFRELRSAIVPYKCSFALLL